MKPRSAGDFYVGYHHIFLQPHYEGSPMKPYFVWKATNCPEDRIEEIQESIKSEVSRCISMNHQEIPGKLRIEVSDGPMSLIGDVTTSDGKTIVRFTYSLLQSGNGSYQFFGDHDAK